MDAGEQTNDQTGGQRDAGPADRLWDFATGVYAKPGVSEACLQAQDELGADVNIMLFAAWCAVEGRALVAEDLAKAEHSCQHWRNQVIAPLRRQRRRWREQAAHASEYAAIKQLELLAERQQLVFLAALAPGASPAGLGDPKTLLAANLRALGEHYQFTDNALDGFRDALLAS